MTDNVCFRRWVMKSSPGPRDWEENNYSHSTSAATTSSCLPTHTQTHTTLTHTHSDALTHTQTRAHILSQAGLKSTVSYSMTLLWHCIINHCLSSSNSFNFVPINSLLVENTSYIRQIHTYTHTRAYTHHCHHTIIQSHQAHSSRLRERWQE